MLQSEIEAQARKIRGLVKELYTRALHLEESYQPLLTLVPTEYRSSARNLLHYLALRQSDVRNLQNDLAALGLSSLGRLEAHSLATLNAVLRALAALANDASMKETLVEPPVDFYTGPLILSQHARILFGTPAGKRNVRIMVTMPSEAADDPELVRQLLASGMDVMRINCAHDGPDEWLAMIRNLRKAEKALGRPCKVYADLAGPKLRTGVIEPEGRLIKIQPKRNLRGQVVRPAQVRLVSNESVANAEELDPAALPVPDSLLQQLQLDDTLHFVDARQRKRQLKVAQHLDGSWWTTSDRTCYVETRTEITLVRKGGIVQTGLVGRLPEVSKPIHLEVGENLVMTKSSTIGKHAVRGADGTLLAPSRIPCTLDAAFDAVEADHRVWLDDGKIGGIVLSNHKGEITIRIVHAPPQGANLRAEKGINLPDSTLDIPALSDKDLHDLAVLAPHIDIIGFSFVRSAKDVELLHAELDRLRANHVGVVLKIETKSAFEALPEMLLTAMRRPVVGVMVARGDLAVETGFERLAEVQEEILWFCEAAHVPVIWATQVLENLAKSGQPTRSEVSDAVMSGRAECVMLNKGPYITSTVQFLSNILERMDAHQSKKRSMLRKLSVSEVVGAPS
ncbi:MAG: pyruvate kinase [Caldilineaceae bacterium]